MAGTFSERIDNLREVVGRGQLLGRVEFDQVYAHYQEVNDGFSHPRGGQAHYLGGSVLTDQEMAYGAIAAELLDHGPVRPMEQAVEHLSALAESRAPRELNNLMNSGHPTVTENGAVVYDRPPVQHRLTPAELKVLDDLRRAADPIEHHPYGNRGLGPKGHAEAAARAHVRALALRRAKGRPAPKPSPRYPGGSPGRYPRKA